MFEYKVLTVSIQFIVKSSYTQFIVNGLKLQGLLMFPGL